MEGCRSSCAFQWGFHLVMYSLHLAAMCKALLLAKVSACAGMTVLEGWRALGCQPACTCSTPGCSPASCCLLAQVTCTLQSRFVPWNCPSPAI